MREFCGVLLVALLVATGGASAALPIEDQVRNLMETLEGERVGFITNPTAVDGSYRHLADRLHIDPGVEIVAFFAPEHGIRGDAQAGDSVDDMTDPVTGVRVYSLYGERRAPTPEQLEGIDSLLFDIQDVGARFYTYIWTMSVCMEAAAEADVRFVVFDRPNPIGLTQVEGSPNTRDEGMIGRLLEGEDFGLPVRHAMTVGEVATYLNGEWYDGEVDLEVVAVPGYHRGMTFEETGYPWVMPSPNMPTRETALVYPGTCLFEGTNLSEGRGTTRPFELIGAPYVNGIDWAAALNSRGLPGVRFRPAWFTPTFDDHAGQSCGGVQVHVIDPAIHDAVYTGLVMLEVAKDLYPDEVEITPWAGRLMGVPDLDELLDTGDAATIAAGWQDRLAAFQARRAEYLLYPAGETSGWNLR